MTKYSGDLRAPSGRFALVASRFNSFIVEHLTSGAIDGLRRHGVAEEDIDLIHVPGSLEIPLVALRLARSESYVAVICLGCVIRGRTDHYEIVSQQSAKGIAEVALQTEIPIVNAILTTANVEQAVDRAGAKMGNKGFEAATVALEMVDLLQKLPGQ